MKKESSRDRLRRALKRMIVYMILAVIATVAGFLIKNEILWGLGIATLIVMASGAFNIFTVTNRNIFFGKSKQSQEPH